MHTKSSSRNHEIFQYDFHNLINLHYEVHKNGEVVNPLNFYYGSISAKEYVLISKLANQENQSLD